MCVSLAHISPSRQTQGNGLDAGFTLSQSTLHQFSLYHKLGSTAVLNTNTELYKYCGTETACLQIAVFMGQNTSRKRNSSTSSSDMANTSITSGSGSGWNSSSNDFRSRSNSNSFRNSRGCSSKSSGSKLSLAVFLTSNVCSFLTQQQWLCMFTLLTERSLVLCRTVQTPSVWVEGREGIRNQRKVGHTPMTYQYCVLTFIPQ